MNIRPTTIHKANIAGTKIAVYDPSKQSAVLLFSSMYLCIQYCFSHVVKGRDDIANHYYLVNVRCCQQKQKEDKNVFGVPLTYRLMNDEQKKLIGDAEYVVLDEQFKNKSFEHKRETKSGYSDNKHSYALESILEKGDLVAIIYGKLAGQIFEILEVKDKKRGPTPGTKYYSLDIGGNVMDFKANSLKLFEKREFSNNAA